MDLALVGCITFSHVTSDGLVQPWKEFPTLHPFAWDVVRDGTQELRLGTFPN